MDHEAIKKEPGCSERSFSKLGVAPIMNDSPPKPARNEAKVRFGKKTYSWPIKTSDDVSIGDWVLRRLCIACPKRQLNKDKLIFRKRDDSVINLGWNPSILINELSDDGAYDFKAEFKNKMNHNMWSHQSRSDFPKLPDYQEVHYIRVKNTGIVSRLNNLEGIKYLLVHYLVGETLYEALHRDRRFDNLPCYDLLLTKKNDTIVDLGNLADLYREDDFHFVKRSKPSTHLPEVTPYQDQPKATEKCSNDTETSTTQQQIVHVEEQTKTEKKSVEKVPIFIYDKELLSITAKNLSVKLNVSKKESDEKVAKKIEKHCKATYDKYAIKEKHQLYTADLQLLVRICHSVGAVIVEHDDSEQDFKGTCYRIGSQFVITNFHVYSLVKDDFALGNAKHVLVDFDYNECKPEHGKFNCNQIPLVFSENLDYAIFKLEPQHTPQKSIPPSLIGSEMLRLPGYISNSKSLDGKFLYFVGHPDGGKTATNLRCPVINPDTIKQEFVITTTVYGKAEWLDDDFVKTYDISTFFHGSSGSPGFLIKERMLMVIHSRGILFNGAQQRSVEQGVKLSAIILDILEKINNGKLNYTFKDLFGVEVPSDYLVSMDID